MCKTSHSCAITQGAQSASANTNVGILPANNKAARSTREEIEAVDR